MDQKQIRQRVAAYAYALELVNDKQIISRAEYQTLADQVDVSIETDHELFDEFFKKYYKKDSIVWIRKHPDFFAVDQYYKKLKKENT